jgi:hypothetical protein
MNLKTQAMLHTAGIIAGGSALALTLTYLIKLITPQQGEWILLAGFVGLVISIVGLFIYIVYSVNLRRLELEHQEELKKMNTPVDK